MGLARIDAYAVLCDGEDCGTAQELKTGSGVVAADMALAAGWRHESCGHWLCPACAGSLSGAGITANAVSEGSDD